VKVAKLKCSVSVLAVALAWGMPAATIAVAADMPVKARPVPPPAAVSWAGFYLGGHVGYGRARHSGGFNVLSDEGFFPEDLKLKGALGGVHAGFNWDAGNWVFGIEGDWSFMRWKRTVLSESSENTLFGAVNNLASIRGRIGIPLGPERRGLLYVTGGGAYTNAKARAVEVGNDSIQNIKFDRIGGVVGGGLEFAATNQLRVRAETLYYIFNDSTAFTIANSNPGDAVKLRDIWTARVGVSWYFNNPR